MLPKSKRIPRKAFKPLLDSKRYFNSEHFSVKVADSKETKIAVSVSKKVSKSAVIRNKVRRRVYSILKDIIQIIKPNLYLIIVKAGAQNVKGEKLKKELSLLMVNKL
ncbi:MAG: ribonuclease P protein component [Parcubacteria group bacterium]